MSGSPKPDAIPSAARQSLKLSCLWSPVDIGFLVCFRIFFGGVMVYQVGSQWADGWIDFFYVQPVFHFTYPGFGWVLPWSGSAMHAHFLIMGVAAAAILFGLFYRLSAFVFWFTFTHTFLIEKALYQNHYYLLCLISFLLIFLPAHTALSLDVLRRPSLRCQVTPIWTLWLLLNPQIAIPYFFGGVAKINSDWLQGMPLRLWLGRHTGFPAVAQLLSEDTVAYLFSYGGLCFDLLIVPCLLWERTRRIAFLLSVLFHLTNAALFDIGIFPVHDRGHAGVLSP